VSRESSHCDWCSWSTDLVWSRYHDIT